MLHRGILRRTGGCLQTHSLLCPSASSLRILKDFSDVGCSYLISLRHIRHQRLNLGKSFERLIRFHDHSFHSRLTLRWISPAHSMSRSPALSAAGLSASSPPPTRASHQVLFQRLGFRTGKRPHAVSLQRVIGDMLHYFHGTLFLR